MENTKRDKFIEEVYALIGSKAIEEVFCADSIDFLERLKRVELFVPGCMSNDSDSKTKGNILTGNGAKILQFMQDNKDKYNNIFKSKEIAEGLFVSSRSVSGSMRKIITDGYVVKAGSDPVCYSLTDAGAALNVNNAINDKAE